MITIATFTKSEDAHLLRMRLEAGGIAAYLEDENLAQNWILANTGGGVRVEVADEDEAAARAWLAAQEAAPEAAPEAP